MSEELNVVEFTIGGDDWIRKDRIINDFLQDLAFIKRYIGDFGTLEDTRKFIKEYENKWEGLKPE